MDNPEVHPFSYSIQVSLTIEISTGYFVTELFYCNDIPIDTGSGCWDNKIKATSLLAHMMGVGVAQ